MRIPHDLSGLGEPALPAAGAWARGWTAALRPFAAYSESLSGLSDRAARKPVLGTLSLCRRHEVGALVASSGLSSQGGRPLQESDFPPTGQKNPGLVSTVDTNVIPSLSFFLYWKLKLVQKVP